MKKKRWQIRFLLLTMGYAAFLVLFAGERVREAAVREGEAKPVKCLALTFDDGPHQELTPLLLDGLKERGAKASFFLIGENISGQEAVVKRIKAEGHLIGNHSFRHVQLTKVGVDQVCRDLEQTAVLIEEITGQKPGYVRPPYGAWNDELECCMDLTTVLWNVDSMDWKNQNPHVIAEQVCRSVKDGDIILMHDIFPASVEAALMIIDRLSEEGWEFVTVNELMVD